METTEHSHPVESFIEKAEKYAGLKTKLLAYKGIDKLAESLSSLLSGALVLIVFIPFFALLNLGICIYLSHAINSLAGAFFIMSGFYLLIVFILALLRKKLLMPSIANLIIKHILK